MGRRKIKKQTKKKDVVVVGQPKDRKIEIGFSHPALENDADETEDDRDIDRNEFTYYVRMKDEKTGREAMASLDHEQFLDLCELTATTLSFVLDPEGFAKSLTERDQGGPDE